MNEYLEVVGVLDDVIHDGHHLDDRLKGLSPLVQQICYGAVRHYYYYSAVIDALVDKPIAPKNADVRLLILAGLYSMENLHRPAHASVNQVVDAAPKLGKGWAKGLVNALLRRYGRQQEEIGTRVRSSSREAATNHPDWLIEKITSDWPQYPEIFNNNNQQAPMTLRVNRRETSRADYLTRLENEGISARAGKLSAEAIILKNSIGVENLPGFDKGTCSIQDEAPQLAPFFMDLMPGQTVLDACAAPGGKTCHILESLDQLTLTAIDRDKKRIPLIAENLARLGLSASVVTTDLEHYSPEHGFDRVLLDAPCSATGIIRRHPDIKLLRTREDIAKLVSLQRVLIDKAFDLLNPGGELLYATCSILHEENDQTISTFLDRTPEAINLPVVLPSTTPDSDQSNYAVTTPFGLQLLPRADEHDGFYYARIRKTAAAAPEKMEPTG